MKILERIELEQIRALVKNQMKVVGLMEKLVAFEKEQGGNIKAQGSLNAYINLNKDVCTVIDELIDKHMPKEVKKAKEQAQKVQLQTENEVKNMVKTENEQMQQNLFD